MVGNLLLRGCCCLSPSPADFPSPDAKQSNWSPRESFSARLRSKHANTLAAAFDEGAEPFGGALAKLCQAWQAMRCVVRAQSVNGFDV